MPTTLARNHNGSLLDNRQALAAPTSDDPPEPSQRADSDDHPEAQADPPPPIGDDLRAVVEQVQRQAELWRDQLAVSIGRARELTELDESRIRYFESLGALRPAKTTAQPGGTRLYTIAELRCLYALALLVKEHNYRPAEAARLVIANRPWIESGIPGAIADLLRHESSVIADGFLLARLMSQLMDAAQIELGGECLLEPYVDALPGHPPWIAPSPSTRVTGVILPMRAIFGDSIAPTADAVRDIGRAIARAPSGMLVALDRAAMMPAPAAHIPPALASSGRNDSTVLFYSREPFQAPGWDRCHYCAYIPKDRPQLTMILLVESADAPPHLLQPLTSVRAILFDRVLAMSEAIFHEFRDLSLAKNYRYRSDGFQIEHTQATYRQLLETIRSLIFPGDTESMAVLLIPNSVDRPTSLSILAHAGYDDNLAPQAKLDLSGAGQGLCGRAYNLREPFFSLDASNDPRVAYAMEEHSHMAMAVPFVTSWGLPPFGVLYLASKSPTGTISSEVGYLALVLGNILSELLGRWWLARRRRVQDAVLHRHAELMVTWLDRLDQHGPDFQKALDHLEGIWKRIGKKKTLPREGTLALIVFDIDQYRQRVQERSGDLIPLKAQLHVQRAIRKIAPDAPSFWFKNDHACLILEGYDLQRTAEMAQRIASHVRALPLVLYGQGEKKLTITVSAAIQALSYRELLDLGLDGAEQFRVEMTAIVDDLRERANQPHPNTIVRLTAEGWTTI